MLETILPQKLISVIDGGVDRRGLYELRLRKNKSVIACIGGEFRDIGVKCPPEWIEEILLKAGKYSLYAVNEQVKAGFLGVKGEYASGFAARRFTRAARLKRLKTSHL